MSTSKKRAAGQRSGVKRAQLAEIRRFFVLAAFERLKPHHQIQPYSKHSLDALEKEFRKPTVVPAPKDLPLEELETVVIRRSHSPSNNLMASLDAVVKELCNGRSDLSSIRKASRETLRADLKRLGIRSRQGSR